MPTHELRRLISLVGTAYYQQDGNKAVCEVVGKTEDNRIWISLFVNGRSASGMAGTLKELLQANHLNESGWTIKPQF